MNTNNKFLTYLFASIFIHILVIWLVIQLSPSSKVPLQQPKKPVLKSYLVFENKQPKPEKQSPAKQETEAETIESKPTIDKPDAAEQMTAPELVQNLPAKVQEQFATEQSLPQTTKSRISTPYAATQRYLNRLEQNQVSSLTQQSLAEFRKPQPLTHSFGQKSATQYSQERSEAFAAKGSGVKVVAELDHGNTLVRVHGNCMMVKMEKGEQIWMGSNACGPSDPFKGQLQKSLNKYLNKGIKE